MYLSRLFRVLSRLLQFRLSYNNPGKQPSDKFISDYVNEDSTIEDLGTEPAKDIPRSILRYPFPDTSGSDMYYLPTDSEDDAPEESIQGQWTRHLYYERKSVVGLMQFVIKSATDGALTGKAATSVYDADVSDNVKEGNKVYIRLVFGGRDILDLIGDLSIEKGVIKGWVRYIGRSEYEDNKQSPNEEAGGDHGASNDDQGGTKENGSRDEDDGQSSNDEEGDEENNDGVGEAVSQGEDRVVLEKDTDGKSTSSPQNDETDAADEGHSGTANPQYHEADVRHDDSQAPDSSGSSDPESEEYHYKFILRRTPASLCRFLPGDPRVPPRLEREKLCHGAMEVCLHICAGSNKEEIVVLAISEGQVR